MLKVKEWLKSKSEKQFDYLSDKLCYRRLKDGILFRAGDVFTKPSGLDIVISAVFNDSINVRAMFVRDRVGIIKSFDKIPINSLPLEECTSDLNTRYAKS